MKKSTIYFLLVASSLFIGCNKDETPTSDYFMIEMVDGRKFTTRYVNIPIPTSNGTFSMQYNSQGGIYFWALINNNDNLEAGINLPTKPVLNKVYVGSNSLWVYHILTLNNKDVCDNPIGDCKSEVVFTEFNYPGRVAGSFTFYLKNGQKAGTSRFDFNAK